MKKKLNILIDGHSIGDRTGGNETYWRNLIENLSKVDNYNNYTVKYNKDIESITNSNNFDSKKYAYNSAYYRNLIDIPFNRIKNTFDVYHTQYFLPPFCGKKTVVTIHDISYLHYPEYFTKKQLILNKKLIKSAALDSAHIITVSNFSKSDIVKNYKVDPEKITVTHLAANDSFRVIEDEKVILDMMKKYNIKGKYILTVGNLQPRKNLERLIKAFNQIQKDEKFKHLSLVIVGKKEWQLDKLFGDVEIDERVILTGYVLDEDLPLLYNGCEVFVYPSIFEGFGLPVLEALKCGKAVITSNTSSLPEVAGDSGVLIDPLSINDISKSIVQVLSNKEYHNELSQKALIQANKFSWQKTATDTLGVYEKYFRR